MSLSSTMFLRGVVILMGLVALLLTTVVLPTGVREEWGTNLLPIVLAMLVAIVPFYIALYHTLKLLHLIDKNKAFSEASVAALQRIKYCAVAVGGLFAVGLPYFYYVAQAEDAPGVMVIGIVLAGAPVVIAVFSAVLQKLLQNAIKIKRENDLTV